MSFRPAVFAVGVRTYVVQSHLFLQGDENGSGCQSETKNCVYLLESENISFHLGTHKCLNLLLYKMSGRIRQGWPVVSYFVSHHLVTKHFMPISLKQFVFPSKKHTDYG